MAESISIPQIPLFRNQGVNFDFLNKFEDFLRQENLTWKSKIAETIYNTSIIIHYKKVIELAWKNFKKSNTEESKAFDSIPEGSTMIYNWIVDFLVGISSYKIKLNIIFDGITPTAYSPIINDSSKTSETPEIDPLYSFDNFGASELIHAVKVLRNANYPHKWMFAPYSATPQVYFLHDNYLGSSICGYPDLLLYVYYNFIIDIDLHTGEFEWVKYRKEHQLNLNKNLAKMFLNNGYVTFKGEEHKKVTVDGIRKQTQKCNSEEKYYLKDDRYRGILQALEDPLVFNLEFEVEALSSVRDDSSKTSVRKDLYGMKFSRVVYFSLFIGKLSPKILDAQNQLHDGKGELESQLNIELEERYLKIQTEILQKSTKNILPRSIDEEGKDVSHDASAPIDPMLQKIINSEPVFESIEGSSDDRINTFKFCWDWLKKYFASSPQELEEPKGQVKLVDKQIWPLIIMNLLKDLDFFDENGVKDIVSFYAGTKEWNHDQYVFIVLLMIKTGFLLDFSQVTGEKKSLEDNAINLVCGIISLLDIEQAEPWKVSDMVEDKELQSFYYLSNTLKDSIRNYFETTIFRLVHVQKQISPIDHEKFYDRIKFKNSNGLLFATILKSVLLSPAGSSPEGEVNPAFSKALEPWLKYTSADDFTNILMEALNLWDSVYNMVVDLTDSSKVEYLRNAFDNGNIVLKSKIHELGLDKLL